MLRLILVLFLSLFIACKKEDTRIVKKEKQEYKELNFSNERLELKLRHNCFLRTQEDRNFYCMQAFLSLKEKNKLYSFLSDSSCMVENALVSNALEKIFIFTNEFYTYTLSFNDQNASIEILNLQSQKIELKEDLIRVKNAKTNSKKSLEKTLFIAYEDLFFDESLSLEEKLFNSTNSKSQSLFEKEQKWELWRKNSKTKEFLYNLANSTYYIKDTNSSLSDSLSISLQKREKSFYLSVNNPQSYKNILIKDFGSYEDFFVFKFEENTFLLAKIDKNLLSFYRAKSADKGLKLEKIYIKDKEFFSKDTDTYEVFLSDEGCKSCEEYKEDFTSKIGPNLNLF